MMRARERSIVVALGLATAIGACAPRPAPAESARACRRTTAACVAPAPAYEKDVEPILRRRCFTCHAGNGVATDEHDFGHFETLHAQRAAVASEIAACAMPPSPAPPVPDAEADVLLRWVACGGALNPRAALATGP